MNNSLKYGSMVLLVGIILLSIGCGKDSTEPGRTPTSTYPLTTGSRWVYEKIWYDVPFNDSSLADTIAQDIYRHIIGPDTGAQINGLIVSDDTVITHLPGFLDTSIYRSWLKIEDARLKQYAYSTFQIGDSTDPSYNDSPHILLDFPLSAGKTWVGWYGGMDGSGYEERRIAGIDYLEIPGGWQYCDVLFSAIINPSLNDTVLRAYEWYDDDGLMRYEADYGIRDKTDDNGTFLDSVRTLELWELIDFDIQP